MEIERGDIMAERSGFFDAILSGGTYDRTYSSDDFSRMFSLLISSGVFINPANQLMVVAKSGLTVTVKAGSAFIDGHWYILDEDKDITLSANSSSNVRTDVIVCELTRTDRRIESIKKEGVSSTLPVNNGTIHDLVLAEIRVGVGAVDITDADITDRRPYNEYCGYVKGMVGQIDTSDLFLQFTSAFNEWFNDIKGKLGEDVATSLQSQINDITESIGSQPVIRSGIEAPSDATGKDGDVYIQIVE